MGIAIGTCLGSKPARAGLKFGVRAGYANLDGDIFKGSGDLGDVRLLGVQAIFPLATLFELELAGEGTSRKIRFDRATFEDEVFSGRAEWDDLAVYSSLRLHLFPLAAGPFSLYGGGGLGLHFTDVKVTEVVEEGPEGGLLSRGGLLTRERSHTRSLTAASALQTPDDFIDDVAGEGTDFEWHLLGGAGLGIPIFPIELFAEGRYRDITGEHGPQGFAIYGGLNIKLP